MTKLTDTQTLILTRASARPGNLAQPLPEGLHGAAAKMAIGRMIKLGWIEEVDANLRRKEPFWRETGDGHGTTLIATEAGLDAIGIDPLVVKTMAGLRDAKPEAIAAAQRPGTKQAQLIAMLQAPEGASIAEIAEATGWQHHSIRGAISGSLKKKLGLEVTSYKIATRGRVYSLPFSDKWNLYITVSRLEYPIPAAIFLAERVKGTAVLSTAVHLKAFWHAPNGSR
ncbi:MAG: DUF3489 domain-containing protein [Paracoccus denitrificans]|uniref:DUF3489 domain-containing protein n=1 Tax=Paracoccus denitrificans TaxID=266 RepID=A0A533I0G8_PARDE|nr:MAG: DUF3489 domain-containing protein [Paracoccus denitrificans]